MGSFVFPNYLINYLKIKSGVENVEAWELKAEYSTTRSDSPFSDP